MTRPALRATGRTLWWARGRVGLMVVAVTVALLGILVMLVNRSLLLREADAAYLATNPATATIEVAGGVDAPLLAAVRERPGILDATARGTVTTRARVGEEWRRMLLLVLHADDRRTVAGFDVESGVWPPASGSMLLERAALPVLGTEVGQDVQVAAADGSLVDVRVTGTVYDPSLAPAGQERAGYGYLTPEEAERLGFGAELEELRVVVGGSDGRAGQDEADAVVRATAAWITAQGYEVHQVLAPPLHHPHQNQTDTVTTLFLVVGAVGLLLAGVVVAATLGGMLAARTRDVGVMKAVGARTGRVVRLQLLMAVVVGVAATALALAPGVAGGLGLARMLGDLLNIEIADTSVPPGPVVLVAAAGIAVPVLVALVPVGRAAATTVREALDGPATSRVGSRRTDRVLARLRGERISLLALRNLARRPVRTALSVVLLAVAGAVFTAGLGTAQAWSAWVDDGLERRHDDVQLDLAAPSPEDLVRTATTAVGGVDEVQTLTRLAATAAGPDGTAELQRTFPDGGHGSLSLLAVSTPSPLLDLEVTAGRWLEPGDSGGVVLNQSASSALGEPVVGDEVALVVEGHPRSVTVVGTVAEVGGPAAAYTVPATLVGGPWEGTVTSIRLSADGDVGQVADEVARSLADEGVVVRGSLATTELRGAVDQHVVIFIVTLVTLAVLMAVVGVLGLGSAAGIDVTERTREYAVLRSVGAAPRTIRRLVRTEAAVTALLGAGVAIALGIPLTGAVSGLLGRLTFGLPLPAVVSAPGVLAWLGLAVSGALVATAGAARRASCVPLRAGLAFQ